MEAHRRISMLLVTIVLLAGAATAFASEPSAEEANRAVAKAFESAWNAHDMKAFGRLLSEDVVWINVNAGRGAGRELVESNHARVHAGKFKDSVFTVTNVEVQSIKPDVALVYVSWGIRGDTDNDGTPRQPREGLFTWLTLKQGAEWKIRSSHNTNKSIVR
jgi:uncharacterized protein (TIGR02246 family)